MEGEKEETRWFHSFHQGMPKSASRRSPGAGWAARRAGGRGEPSHSVRSAKTCPPPLSWAVTPTDSQL